VIGRKRKPMHAACYEVKLTARLTRAAYAEWLSMT